MAQVPLSQGAYTARNVIANAQGCVNLYPEPNPKDAPFPLTHYPAPGTSLFIDLSGYGSPIRGLYAAGELIGGLFYFNYPGGSGLMSGTVFGKIAGAAAGRSGKN